MSFSFLFPEVVSAINTPSFSIADIKPTSEEKFFALLSPYGVLFNFSTDRPYQEAYDQMDQPTAEWMFLALKPTANYDQAVYHFVMVHLRENEIYDSLANTREDYVNKWGFNLPKFIRRRVKTKCQEPHWNTCGFWATYFFLQYPPPEVLENLEETNVNMLHTLMQRL